MRNTLTFHKRAFSVLEYTLLIVAVASGLLISFNYLKRGLQGRFQRNADVFSDRQYIPGRTIIVGD